MVLDGTHHLEKGKTDVGTLTFESASYIAGYVTKKMTHKETSCSDKCVHPPLSGRHPEFANMSKKPGIGALYLDTVASALVKAYDTSTFLQLPTVLTHGRRKMPLGRYLNKRLQSKLKETSSYEDPEVISVPKIMLSSVQECIRFHAQGKENVVIKATEVPDSKETIAQKRLNIETRTTIFKGDKKL